MERVSVGIRGMMIRGALCLLPLIGLAACNDGSSSGTSDSTAMGQSGGTKTGMHIPPVVTPIERPVTQPTQTDDTDDSNEPPPAGNAAPHIAGSPKTEAVVGQAFTFQPNATDADDDALTFSIASKPAWASFDASSGHLWGTPTAGDVGSSEEIVISVSDGQATKALPEFAVNVVAQSNGSATIAWEPPTENTDGSPLTNLKGYKIHYGTQSGAYETTVSVSNAGLSSYVIENLTHGTYFFAISAISLNGAESDLSAEASKTI